jgi:hypothetical protein
MLPSSQFMGQPIDKVKRFNEEARVSQLERRKDSASESLARGDVTDIKLFLQYRIQASPKYKNGGKLRQSTVEGYYKNLQTVFALDTKRQLSRETNRSIGNFIKNTLSPRFDLIMEQKDCNAGPNTERGEKRRE